MGDSATFKIKMALAALLERAESVSRPARLKCAPPGPCLEEGLCQRAQRHFDRGSGEQDALDSQLRQQIGQRKVDPEFYPGKEGI